MNSIDVSSATVPPKNEVISETPTDCSICLDKFTAVVRKHLSCPYCLESFCSQCVEKYLLNTIDDPHCMACRRGWSQALLQTFCTKTFLTKTYPEYRSAIILNRQKALLPQCQIQAERIVAAEKFSERNIPLNKKLNELNDMLKSIQTEQNALLKQINSNQDISFYIRQGRRDLEGNLIQGQNTHGSADGSLGATTDSVEKRKFVRRCPAEGCNGFLSTAWKCGICSNWSCPDCFIVKGQDKDAEHQCKPEDKATADLIRKRAKPCPNCGELIEKAEGCDQMFCTACHSPFSWNKGEIIKSGIVHNPHYFEWLARNGVRPVHGAGAGAIGPCGGLPGFYRIQVGFTELTKSLSNTNDVEPRVRKCISNITNAYRTVAHIVDVECPHYSRLNREYNVTEIGVQFLLKKLTEDEWKRIIKTREMSRLKAKEIHDILEAFGNAGIDIFRQIYDDVEKKWRSISKKENCIPNLEKWCDQMSQLREFMNTPLMAISKIYNCVVPQIKDDFTYHTNSITKERKKAREAAAVAARDKLSSTGTSSKTNSETSSLV